MVLHSFFIKVRIYFSAYLVLNVPTSSEGWVIKGGASETGGAHCAKNGASIMLFTLVFMKTRAEA